MAYKKAKIGLTSVVIIGGILIVLGLSYPSFLASSVVRTSFVAEEPESPEKKLIEVRFERDNLILDKRDKMEEKASLEGELVKIDAKMQEIKEKIFTIQKSLDEVNNAIASISEPNIRRVEEFYSTQISEENIRYEKEKELDQKLYIDTMNLIKKTYDDKVISIPESTPEEERKNRIEEAADLATINRKNALQSLTDINLDHLSKHQGILDDLEEKNQIALRDEKRKTEELLAPLIQKKQLISEQKTEIQKEQTNFLQQHLSITSALKDITESIRSIDLSVNGIDYKILILEENIVR